MQDTNNRKGKALGQDEYERIKGMLVTRSPLELSKAGVCGYSTAYKIMNSTGYGDYRNKLREERERFYNKRKATEIKKNVPPIGAGAIRFTPPKQALDGTGNTSTIFGSPFRESPQHVPKEKPQNGPVIVVKQGTDQPEAVIDVKSGPSSTYSTPVTKPIIPPYGNEADKARSHNAKVSLFRDGVDAFQFVDRSKLHVTRGRLPDEFSESAILGVCSLARTGGTPGSIRDYLKGAGYGGKSMDQICRTIAYNESGLEEFKKAWKDGTPEREKNIRQAMSNGGKRAAQKLWAGKKPVKKEEPKLVEQVNEFLNDPTAKKAILTMEKTEKSPAIRLKEETGKDNLVTAGMIKEAVERVALKEAENIVEDNKPEKKVIKIDGKKLSPDHVIDGAYTNKNPKRNITKKVKVTRKHMSYSTVILLSVQFTFLALKLAGFLEDFGWFWVFLPAYVWAANILFSCLLLGALTVFYYLDYVKEEEHM